MGGTAVGRRIDWRTKKERRGPDETAGPTRFGEVM